MVMMCPSFDSLPLIWNVSISNFKIKHGQTSDFKVLHQYARNQSWSGSENNCR